MAKTQKERLESLLPNGIPKYVRCYDQGEDGTVDRYTVCYTGKAPTIRSEGCAPEYPYVGMSANPFHPQGVGMHGSTRDRHCDVIGGCWPPAMGRRHPNLGKRIPFTELPEACQRLVIQDYKDYWVL